MGHVPLAGAEQGFHGGILGVLGAVAGHEDALDFDLYDRWRVRLRDVPATIGWDGLALFLRHLPLDSELARELDARAEWSTEAHLLATVSDQISGLMYGLGGAKGPKPRPIDRPGQSTGFEGAVEADVNERIAQATWKEDADGR